MKILSAALFLLFGTLYSNDVSFRELGVDSPLKVSHEALEFYLPLSPLAGSKPSQATLEFKDVTHPFTVVLLDAEGKELIAKPDALGEVVFPLFPNEAGGSLLHIKIVPEIGADFSGWIGTDSVVNYVADPKLPLEQLSKSLKDQKLPIFIEEGVENKEAALLNAASQVGAFYTPWRIRAAWAEEKTSPAILVGKYADPIAYDGKDLKVDAAHIGGIMEYLTGFKGGKDPSGVFKEWGYQSKPFGSNWTLILPFAFSDSGEYSGKQRWTLKVSNFSREEKRVEFLSRETVKKVLVVPPQVLDYELKFEFDTLNLPNRTFFAFRVPSGGEDVRISEESKVECLDYDRRATLFFADVPRTFLGEGEVILSEFKKPKIEAAMEVVQFLSGSQRCPFSFSVRDREGGSLERKGYWTLGVLSAEDLKPFIPWVDVTSTFVTKSSFINEKIFPKEGDGPKTFMQVFDKSRPMLALTDLQNDYSAWTKSSDWQEVFLFGAPFAQKERKGWVLIDFNFWFPAMYTDRFKIEDWWEGHKGWVVLAWLFLTFVFLREVWNKLTYKEDL